MDRELSSTPVEVCLNTLDTSLNINHEKIPLRGSIQLQTHYPSLQANAACLDYCVDYDLSETMQQASNSCSIEINFYPFHYRESPLQSYGFSFLVRLPPQSQLTSSSFLECLQSLQVFLPLSNIMIRNMALQSHEKLIVENEFHFGTIPL